MLIYLLAYSGTDKAAHQIIGEIFSNFDGNQISVSPFEKKPNYDVDIVIVDCRNEIISPEELYYQSEYGEIPFIALCNELEGSRKKIFKHGYYDYISWPIVNIEVLRRVNSCLLSRTQHKQRYLFSNIQLVEKACIYMYDNISYAITLEDLSHYLGTNRNTLSKKFKMAFDVSPLAWLRIQRMQSAANQLIKTDNTIINIALSIGYQDANNFSTSFKKLIGSAPSEYRKIVQNSKNSMYMTKILPQNIL